MERTGNRRGPSRQRQECRNQTLYARHCLNDGNITDSRISVHRPVVCTWTQRHYNLYIASIPRGVFSVPYSISIAPHVCAFCRPRGLSGCGGRPTGHVTAPCVLSQRHDVVQARSMSRVVRFVSPRAVSSSQRHMNTVTMNMNMNVLVHVRSSCVVVVLSRQKKAKAHFWRCRTTRWCGGSRIEDPSSRGTGGCIRRAWRASKGG